MEVDMGIWWYKENKDLNDGDNICDVVYGNIFTSSISPCAFSWLYYSFVTHSVFTNIFIYRSSKKIQLFNILAVTWTQILPDRTRPATPCEKRSKTRSPKNRNRSKSTSENKNKNKNRRTRIQIGIKIGNKNRNGRTIQITPRTEINIGIAIKARIEMRMHAL